MKELLQKQLKVKNEMGLADDPNELIEGMAYFL